MVFHARVGVGYVGKGVALRQVMLGLAHVVAGAVEDWLVVWCVVGGGVVGNKVWHVSGASSVRRPLR